MKALSVEEEDIDFDGRELCPDGSCTGVIGADGRCKECGRSASGEAPAPGPGETHAADGEEAFDEDRQLCPDGSCTGLVGPDGKCKECGRSASEALSS